MAGTRNLAVRWLLALGSLLFAARWARPQEIPAPLAQDLVRLVVRDGATVILDCPQERRWSQYYVEEPPRWTWMKDGKPLFTAGESETGRIYQSPNGSLVISQFESPRHSGLFDDASPRPGRAAAGGASSEGENSGGDVGKYQCVSSGPLGRVVFAPIFVQSAKAPSFANDGGHPRSTSVRLGSVVRFRCFVDRDTSPPASYSWKRNQVDLPQKIDSQHYAVLPGGILQIAHARATDSGSYQCIAFNDVGRAVSHAATLSVTNGTASTSSQPRPALFVARPSNVTAPVGTDAFFECLADGEPAPTISWFRPDGRPVPHGPKYVRSGQGNLRIVGVAAADRGAYVCRAMTSTSSLGVSASAILDVVEAPSIAEAPQSVTKVAAETARFVCRPENKGDRLQWLMNGEPLQAVGRTRLLHGGSNLVISQTTAADAGVYQCVVTNSLGFVSAAAHLFFVQSPQAPRRPTISVVAKTSSSISVEWRSLAGRDRSPIVAYTVHYFKKVGDVEQQKIETTTSTTIADLEPFTNYTLYVVAYNKDSASEHSPYVTVATEAGLPLVAPVPVVLSITDSAISVKIQEPPPEKTRGFIVEYTAYCQPLSAKGEGLQKIIPGSSQFFNLTDLTPATSYKM